MKTKIELQKDFIAYLENYGLLTELIEKCRNYIEKIKKIRIGGKVGPSFYFSPIIDIALISEVSDGELASLICQEPNKAEYLLSRVIVSLLNNIESKIPGGISLENVRTPIRVKSVPKLKLENITINSLNLLQGVCVARSTVTKYIRSNVSYCSLEICAGSLGKRFNGKWIRSKCYYCGSDNIERHEEREEGDEILAVFLIQDSIKNKPIDLILRDEIATDIKLGEKYELICSSGLIKNIPLSTLSVCSIPRLSDTNVINIPNTILKAYEKLKKCPGALVILLASKIGQNILPANTFLHIRLATLLSIATLGSSHVVPLLISGSEESMAAKLLKCAAKLAPRTISHGPSFPVAGSVKKLEENEGLWIEAGTLLLASHGVCLLGHWSSLKKDAQSTVLKSIESGNVTLQMAGKGVNNIPLKSAIWTYCGKIPMKQIKPLINVFGLPWLCEVNENEDIILCNWLLDTSVLGHKLINNNNDDEFNITENDIKQFIDVIKSNEVIISSEAKNIIKDYFVASRRARVGGINLADECLPIGSIQLITSLATAHAKLSLSKIVREIDAIAIISLYEQTMNSLFGPSITSPPQLIANLNTSNFTQIEKYMNSCVMWFNSYISSIIGNYED